MTKKQASMCRAAIWYEIARHVAQDQLSYTKVPEFVKTSRDKRLLELRELEALLSSMVLLGEC